jgi:hypothetical protein
MYSVDNTYVQYVVLQYVPTYNSIGNMYVHRYIVLTICTNVVLTI